MGCWDNTVPGGCHARLRSNPLVLHPSAAHLGLGTHQALLLPLQLLQGGLRRQGGLQLSHQLGALRCRLLQLGGGSCRQLRCL